MTPLSTVVVFSPHDLGVPSRRRRKYTMLVNQTWGSFNPNVSFTDLFFRKLMCNVDIYMVAQDDAF